MSLNLALYQSGILQLLQMLRHGGLGNRQFLVDVPNSVSRFAKSQYRYPSGCPNALAKPGYLL